MKKTLLLLLLLPALLARGQNTWPKDIKLSDGGRLTIYQPQPESLKGNQLTGRSAVSVKKTGTAEPLFGAIWFNAVLNTDKDTRMATLESLDITNARFADSTGQTDVNAIAALIEKEIPKWQMEISLDQLLTTLQQEQRDDAGLNNEPPDILYRDKAATLVLFDGEPQVSQDENLKLDRVVNTPFLVVKDPKARQYYLYASNFWYTAGSPTGPYAHVKKLPSFLTQLDREVRAGEKEDANLQASDLPTQPTEIVVSTKPAELLQTDGPATYQSVAGTGLLYADNTLDEIFKDITTQRTYTLISGRWFSAPNLSGPWQYVAADKLPADFAKIPQGSEKDGVLASVAGTTEAQEARMDAQLPQTAKVDRRTAQCDVHYDGTPQFSPIANTNLQVAENANVTVLETSDGRYFAVDNGIWFVSNTPTGPWEVANERPADVERIPPQSPAYNTKYVYVYDYTPDYVYMGYTPGYLGSYISGPTVVYGTGWYYRPWYRRYYYPRPVTWGFGFCYNPWTGWNMSFGMVFNFGWYHMGGSYPYYGGWFGGPAYWRPPYRPWGWNGGYYGRRGAPIRTTRPNVRVNRPRNMYAAPARANYAAVNRGHSNNIYNRAAGIRDTRDVRPGIVRPGTSPVRPGVPGNNTRPTNPGTAPVRPGVPGNDTRPVRPGTPGNDTRPTNPGTAPVRPGTPGNDTRPVRPGVPGTTPTRPVNPTPRPGTNPQRPATRPNNNSNNVLTDPDGNVYQRNNNGGWDQRNNSRWQSSGQNRNADLDRQQSSRERGANRNDNFRQTMPQRQTPQRSTQPSQRQSTPQRSAPPPQRQSAPARSAPQRGGRNQ